MPREGRDAKAARLRASGAVRVTQATETRVQATVTGDTGSYSVSMTDGRWQCDCQVQQHRPSATCSHIGAVRQTLEESGHMATDETGAIVRQTGLYRKLAAVQAAVTYLQKHPPKRAGTLKYNYVSSTNVLESIRPIMDEQGLLCLVEVVGTELLPGAAFGGKNHLMKADLRFTWIDVDKPEDREVLLGVGYGAGDDEKSIGKALTYGEKYHFLKVFHIPTDDDDPDAHQGTEPAKPATNKPALAPAPAKPAFVTEGRTQQEIHDAIVTQRDCATALLAAGFTKEELAEAKRIGGFGERKWPEVGRAGLQRIYARAVGLEPGYNEDGQITADTEESEYA